MSGAAVVGTVLKGLDLLVWLVTLGPLWMAISNASVPRLRAKEVDTADVNGKLPPSKIFRCIEAIQKGELSTNPIPGVTTLYGLVLHAVQKYAKKNALGTRTYLGSSVIEGSKFPTKQFGSTKWLTYEQVDEKMHNFGSGLRGLGMEPLHLKEGQSFDDVTGPHGILMYENTCAEWLMAALGASSQSLVIATCYATLGVESVITAVQEGSIVTIVCNYYAVKDILKRKSEMPTLKNIIYTTLYVEPKDIDQHPGKDDTITVLSFDEVCQKGAEKKVAPSPPTARDVCILMYTSGSTGKPKGVVVRNSQLIAAITAIRIRAKFQIGEVLVGYLPLAHIFEMMMEIFVFGWGGEIGYADPKTLSGGPGKCMPHGALLEFRPTIMGAVPKVWEVIKSGAEAKIKASGKEQLFNAALEWKKTAVTQFRETPVFDKLVFAKIRATLGGRLRLAVSGGGAISGSVQEWVRAVFGCPLIQGYGLTETCAGLTVQAADDMRVGVVGAPIETVEVLLHSEPEITDFDSKPYLSTDTNHMGAPCKGRGEVWARGNNLTDGYYKMPKETASEFDKDGWFHTGDIGIITPDGTIKIVDRKKNIVKLKGGEYIALERMNQAFNQCQYVDVDGGGVCAYGDSEMDRPVCLVQMNAVKVGELAKSLGIEETSPEKLSKNEKIIAEVTKALNLAGKNTQPPLSSLEVLASVALLTKPWSALEGTLTASLKIVPKQIQMAHAEELAAVKSKGIR